MNKGFMASLPDTYVLTNTFRKVGKQERCFSTAKTAVATGSINPVFQEDLRLSCVGQGCVVINVMSRHTLGGDTIIGQAIINLEKYRSLYKGEILNVKLPLKNAAHAVHDTTGTKMSLTPGMPLTQFNYWCYL